MQSKVLKFIFPDVADKIVEEPLPGCPYCNGEGHYKNKIGRQTLCICTRLSGGTDFRLKVVTSFRDSVSSLVKDEEFKKKAIAHATRFLNGLLLIQSAKKHR